ncbi:MAG: phosphatidate cytidylyltransferase [Bacilli bacterium]
MNEIKRNHLTEDTKKSMMTRIITSIIALIIVLPSIFLGEWFFFVLIMGAGIFATIEIVRCAKRKYSPVLYILSIVLVLLLSCWPIIRTFSDSFPGTNFRIFLHFDKLYLSIIVLFIGLCLVLWTVLIDKNFTVRDATYIFTFLLILSLGMQSAILLRSLPSYNRYLETNTLNPSYFNWFDSFLSSTLVIYVIIGAFMTDIGAYFIGIFFGRNKINERISPKKTWEGFIGGIIISTICSFFFAFILALCGHPILPKLFTVDRWYFILILSFIMPFFSTLGDFVFSSAKRFYDIKDYGSVLPGHGGIMDRIDSLVFSLIISAVVINIANLIINGEGLSSLI